VNALVGHTQFRESNQGVHTPRSPHLAAPRFVQGAKDRCLTDLEAVPVVPWRNSSMEVCHGSISHPEDPDSAPRLSLTQEASVTLDQPHLTA
jgi:hypothetical protein